METAYHIFKNHPNFDKIDFVLAPEIREKIGISGDIPLSNSEWLRAYDCMYKDMFKGRLDLTQMRGLLNRKQPWYFRSLYPETQRHLSSKMQVYFKNDYTGAAIDTITTIFPARLETIPNIKERGDKFRKQLLREVNTGKYQMAADGQKVGIVGHSVFFKVYTASEHYW